VKHVKPVPVGRIVTGDCVRTMERWKQCSVDAIITSPPYPLIKRPYGRWTEPQWLKWMQGVVKAGSRLLKPKGSMVFIIGPNFTRSGSVAQWPYRFVLDIFGMGLNVIQDAYWIKTCRIPMGQVRKGLMRDAVEWCVWIGPPDCYRDQQSVLWEYSASMKKLIDMARRGRVADIRKKSPSGATVNEASFAIDRGGATPMNAIATANAGREAMKHPAAFPEPLAVWWVKYLCPPGGIVLDPFAGSGTTCAAALKAGRQWVGIERVASYARNARLRIKRTAATIKQAQAK